MITFREYCKTIKEDWGTTSPIPKETYRQPDLFKGVNWVDLGLPSGVLWADANITNPLDGSLYWTWDDIMASAYANFVPSKKQFRELFDMNNTDRKWDTGKRAMVLTSRKNGDTLALCPEGFCSEGDEDVRDRGNYGIYWTSDPAEDGQAIGVFFGTHPSCRVLLDSKYPREGSFSVRLVRNKN